MLQSLNICLSPQSRRLWAILAGHATIALKSKDWVHLSLLFSLLCATQSGNTFYWPCAFLLASGFVVFFSL